MQYTLTRGEKGKIEVKVDVPKAAFDEAYGKVLMQLAAQSNISGFRPGKVPVDVAESHVGYNKVLNEAASSLISQHLSQILKKEELIPLDSPKIAINTLAKGSPFAFTVAFTQKPKVQVGDWEAIKVKKVSAKQITQVDIDQSIKNIFEAWKKRKSDVGSQKSDERVMTEVTEKTESTEKFIYDAHGNKVFFNKKNLRSSSSQDSTAGLKIPIKNDPAVSTPGVSQTPSDRGSTPKAQTTPSGVEPPTQPAADDNFAKAIGALDLAHLRELIKKDLETLVADQVEVKFEQDLYDQLLGIIKVDVPDILIDDELNRILVRLSTELEKQGSDLDKYIGEEKTTIDELKTKWRLQAEKNVKITLVMDEIGRNESVKVAKEEIEQALKGVNETDLSADQKQDLERYLALSIFQAKTLDLVKKTVVVL